MHTSAEKWKSHLKRGKGPMKANPKSQTTVLLPKKEHHGGCGGQSWPMSAEPLSGSASLSQALSEGLCPPASNTAFAAKLLNVGFGERSRFRLQLSKSGGREQHPNGEQQCSPVSAMFCHVQPSKAKDNSLISPSSSPSLALTRGG